jgi:N utilization substance protein B
LTVRELATAIARTVEEVQAVLGAGGEPSGPDDVLAGEAAKAVAAKLGEAVNVEARDMALELLYEFEARGELPGAPEGRAERLARGVVEELDRLDAEIEAVSEHWSVVRMPVVDRNILRIGLYELEHDPGVPTAVIISEAVRMAQTYSTERSGSFVNGVLAALARGVRPIG